MLFCERQLIAAPLRARLRWLLRAAALGAVCALAGCGGGGGGGDFIAPPAPPAEDGELIYAPPVSLEQEQQYQWGVASVNAAAAYEVRALGQDVIVGIADSGVLTVHRDLVDNLVPGRRFDHAGNAYADINDADGHGTHVAGIVAAAINNEGMHGVAPRASIMPLQLGDPYTGGLSGNWQAAFRYARDNNVRVINNSWGAIDEMMGGMVNGMTVMFNMPRLTAQIAAELNSDSANVRSEMRDMSNIMASADDMALVWAAGNSGWQSDGFVYFCDVGGLSIPHGACQGPVNSAGDPEYNPAAVVNKLPISVLLTGFVTQDLTVDVLDVTIQFQSHDYGDFAALGITENSVGDFGLAPYFHPDLLGNFIAVVATDQSNNIAWFSNGCGPAMHWCMAAPGVNITSASISGEAYRPLSGTSMSAPHVSGGLAVLRSYLQSMPMNVIVTMLLTNAVDLGADGVDEVYGWGLMDLGAAITAQNGMVMAGTDGARVFGSMAQASPALRGLSAGLAGVSVAVAYGPELYFNMPLSELLKEAPPEPLAASGLAAAQMLRGGAREQADAGEMPAPGLAALQNAADGAMRGAEFLSGGAMPLQARYEWCGKCGAGLWDAFSLDAPAAAPFFANAEGQRAAAAWRLPGRLQLFGDVGLNGDARSVTHGQFGLRRIGELAGGRARWLAEAARISENGAVLGSELAGGMAVQGAAARQGRLALEADAGGWRWFAAALAGRGQAAGADGALLSRLTYRYRAWQAGADGASVLRHGDRMRFGLSRHSGVRRGEALLRPVALTDGGALAASESRVGWQNAPATALHWGYYAKITQNFEVGLGYDLARRGGERADASSVAARWRVW